LFESIAAAFGDNEGLWLEKKKENINKNCAADPFTYRLCERVEVCGPGTAEERGRIQQVRPKL
jgi:hypothetical protein